jgi:hypothetical protein
LHNGVAAVVVVCLERELLKKLREDHSLIVERFHVSGHLTEGLGEEFEL